MAIIAVAILLIPVSIIVLQSLSLGVPFVDAGSREPQSESEGLSDTENQPPDIESQSEGSDTGDTESEETSDTDTNEFAATPSEDKSNTRSSTPPPESITMSPSDLIPDNQTSNQTIAKSNATLTLEEKLTKAIIPETTIKFTSTVKVKFESIQIQETHDPGPVTPGDGEYDLYAFVQGVPIGLTDRSWKGTCGGASDPLPCGLGDVSHGETVYFTPSAEVTVQIPGTIPLSIFTAGNEVDCHRTSTPQYVSAVALKKYIVQPEETWARNQFGPS